MQKAKFIAVPLSMIIESRVMLQEKKHRNRTSATCMCDTKITFRNSLSFCASNAWKASHYGNRVIGSSAHWRNKKKEVHSWINYNIEKGHGMPSFFITLSCAEYHWPDIKRLIS